MDTMKEVKQRLTDLFESGATDKLGRASQNGIWHKMKQWLWGCVFRKGPPCLPLCLSKHCCCSAQAAAAVAAHGHHCH